MAYNTDPPVQFVRGGGQGFFYALSAAGPGAQPKRLPRLRELHVSGGWLEDDSDPHDPGRRDYHEFASGDDARLLLSHCEPAALTALTLEGFTRRGGLAPAVGATRALTALRALRLDGGWAAWLEDDRVEPALTRLEVMGDLGDGVPLARPWARALVELRLSGVSDEFDPHAYGSLDGRATLRALAPIAGLPHLRRLELEDCRLDAAALDEAVAAGWADDWAPRLAELCIHHQGMEAGALAALARLPFAALERLRVGSLRSVRVEHLRALTAAAAPWLPRLRALELTASVPEGDGGRFVDALGAEGGPLAALHRGGGVVRAHVHSRRCACTYCGESATAVAWPGPLSEA